jgi:hypothetical protein
MVVLLLYGGFVWACRVFSSPPRRFSARAAWDIRVEKLGRCLIGVVAGSVPPTACMLHKNAEAWTLLVGSDGAPSPWQ